MAIISFFECLVFMHCALCTVHDWIHLTITTKGFGTFKIEMHTSQRISKHQTVIFDEDLTSQASEKLDRIALKRDWKLRIADISAYTENRSSKKRNAITIRGIVHNRILSFKRALLAIGYPVELQAPLIPVVYYKKAHLSISFVATIDWRRYIKVDDIDKKWTINPNTHKVHITREEHKRILDVYSEFGKIIKVEAVCIDNGNVYRVTSCNLKNELIFLSVDSRLGSTCDSIGKYINIGCTFKEAKIASELEEEFNKQLIATRKI